MCVGVKGPRSALASIARDVGPEESRKIYGDAKIARLSELKRVWDPDNVFHVNPNVAPASADVPA